MPLVNSRTITKSVCLTRSSFKGENWLVPSVTLVGRILANKPNFLRNANNPCSGRLLGSVHFGPPTAPNKIASASWQAESVSLGRGVPCVSMAAPPKS